MNVLLDAATIAARVNTLAAEIERDYAGDEEIHLVGVVDAHRAGVVPVVVLGDPLFHERERGGRREEVHLLRILAGFT